MYIFSIFNQCQTKKVFTQWRNGILCFWCEEATCVYVQTIFSIRIETMKFVSRIIHSTYSWMNSYYLKSPIQFTVHPLKLGFWLLQIRLLYHSLLINQRWYISTHSFNTLHIGNVKQSYESIQPIQVSIFAWAYILSFLQFYSTFITNEFFRIESIKFYMYNNRYDVLRAFRVTWNFQFSITNENQ